MIEVIVTSTDDLKDLLRDTIRQELGNLYNRQCDEKKYLTIEEASQYSGIPKNTLYQYTSQRLIPFTKGGRRVMFVRTELDAWLTSRRKATRQEIENEVFTKKQGKK